MLSKNVCTALCLLIRVNRHRQRFNKRPKFEHIQNVLQAEKRRQVPGHKSKKSLVHMRVIAFLAMAVHVLQDLVWS